MFDKLINRIEKQAVIIHHLKLSRKFRIETTKMARAERDQVVANYNEKTSELIKIINAQDIEINKKNQRIDFLLNKEAELRADTVNAQKFNRLVEEHNNLAKMIHNIRCTLDSPFKTYEGKVETIRASIS